MDLKKLEYIMLATLGRKAPQRLTATDAGARIQGRGRGPKLSEKG